MSFLGDKQDYSEESVDDLFEHHRLEVHKGQKPLRIDVYTSTFVEGLSRNRVQLAAKAGCLRVNGKPVKSNYKVNGLDLIQLVLPRPIHDKTILPEDIPLDIRYEDDDVIVVHKPAGMVVHPGHGNYTGTLCNALAHHAQNLPSASENFYRPGIVHRLDKDTTGLMIIAKNETAMTHLAKQFFDRTVHRRYYALVWGDVEQEAGTIEGHLGRNPRNRKVMQVFPDGLEGKHAITHYKVIERFGYITMVECRLETGRTHQIRAHFQYIKHPLFSDSTYGGDRIVKGTIFSKYKQFVDNCFKILPRQALHAKSLGFTHPTTKEQMMFDSEMPDDIQHILTKWRRYMGTETNF